MVYVGYAIWINTKGNVLFLENKEVYAATEKKINEKHMGTIFSGKVQQSTCYLKANMTSIIYRISRKNKR